MGQIVQFVNPNVSHEFAKLIRQFGPMPTINEERSFNEALGHRLRDLRKRRDWTSETMAKALGIPPDRYRKYETRPASAFPPYLIERVALIFDESIEYVLTGRHPKAETTPPKTAPQKADRQAS